jgi:hypothetical protein
MPSLDEALLQAGSLAFAMIRFADGAAHPSRGARAPDEPRLGRDVYTFAPSTRSVPRAEVPAFFAGLPSPAMLMPTTTRGIVSLFLLDELSGERGAAARRSLANQQAGLEHLAGQLALTADSPILLEFDNEAHVVPLAVLRVWSERFAVDIGWSLEPLEGDPRASTRLRLLRADGIDAPPRPRGMLVITSDVPVAWHTDAEMVLAALRRHVSAVMERPMEANVVRVWLMLDGNGRMERTSVSLEPPTGDRGTYAAALLEPFPDERLGSFESVGSILVPAGYGPNTIAVKWLQRRADVTPDAENGVYQFDAQRLLPPRAVLEDGVKERYPEYARVGLTGMGDIPVREVNAPFEPTADECIVPWFIANEDATVLESWLGPVLQNPLIARQMIEKRHPNLRFTSVRIGDIRTENGSWPSVVWATIEALPGDYIRRSSRPVPEMDHGTAG